MYDVQRIDALRSWGLTPKIDYGPFYYYFQRSYIANHGEGRLAIRYARAVTDAFNQWAVSISPGELIVGKPDAQQLSAEELAEWELIQRYANAEMHAGVGQESHMAIDYDRLMALGTSGVRALIDEKIAALPADDPETVKKQTWYQACQMCLSAVESFSDRYADHAEKLAEAEADPVRREELFEIAETCRAVPKNPPKTFRQAVQSASFVTFCLSMKPFRPSMHQYQLGRPDRYLYPFYQADMEKGIMSEDQAQTLIDCLCVQINCRVPNGLSSGYMVGGRDASGKVVSNPLTKMFMRAVEQVKLVYPSVGLCCCAETPDEDIRLACSILAKGHSHPALFNDEVITKGLRYYGLPAEEACSYIHSTCVEITPCASSNAWVASPYMNLPGELLQVLGAREYESFDSLYAAYKTHIALRIDVNCREQSLCRHERVKYCLDPLLSCFVHDCLEIGLDIEEGGAKYNWIMPSFVGMANVADGLYAMRELIYEQKAFSYADYMEALRTNFASSPELLAAIRELSAYGNNDLVMWNPEWFVSDMSTYIADTCETKRVPLAGGRLIPSMFCWITHDIFGRETSATPDGRAAHLPLGDGSGPAQGREMNGPTTSILSSTCWDHARFIGGIAVNIKFSLSLLGEKSVDTLMALAKTYISRGGFELQVNVTDNKILQEAKLHPENYGDLVVRIGGYSDYFTRLSPSMQDEVILRTTHKL